MVDDFFMLFRGRVVQNEIVARRMRSFVKNIDRRYSGPEAVAKAYGRHLWKPRKAVLAEHEKLSRSRYNVALMVDAGAEEFERVTKRAGLVSDTLLLSHNGSGRFHPLGTARRRVEYGKDPAVPRADITGGMDLDFGEIVSPSHVGPYEPRVDRVHEEWYGIHCPDLEALGKWILDVRELLGVGSVWYLPTYASATRSGSVSERETSAKLVLKNVARLTAADYLIQDRRAVELSGVEPIKGQMVRPILEIDIPFLEGVDMRTFSELTIQEFASYSAFRDFLRQAFLEIDESMNAVQSERELVKLGLQIKDQIRGVESQMRRARGRRAVSATGAAIGSVGAVLVAVYGPAMEQAIAVLGASGGIWGIIHALAENNVRGLREDKWYYVWALNRKSGGS